MDRMIISSTSVIFSPEYVLKHLGADGRLDVFEYQTYSDAKIFVLECVKELIQRRNGRVDIKQKRLFITHRKPYYVVSIDILRRWIKKTFAETNLAENFTPDSCRSASTTQIFIRNLDILWI